MGGLHRASGNATPAAGSFFDILYAEDFDDPVDAAATPEPLAPEPEPEPAITQADVDAACDAAVRAARIEWQREQEQSHLNALSALSGVLAGIRSANEQSAAVVAEGTVTTILSMLCGLLPHVCREHGPAEVRALLTRLLPMIRSQVRITVRVHHDLVASVQSDIAGLEPDLAAMIDVIAAPLEPGDVKVNWENGSLSRDSRQLMQAITDALSQLGLHQAVKAPAKRRMAYAD